MLVLSRHKGQVIRVGEDVVITIVDIRGDKVRVGIEAPRAVGVHRQEVWNRIQKGEPCNSHSTSPKPEMPVGTTSEPSSAASASE